MFSNIRQDCTASQCAKPISLTKVLKSIFEIELFEEKKFHYLGVVVVRKTEKIYGHHWV